MVKKTDESFIKHIYSKSLQINRNNEEYTSIAKLIEEDKNLLYKTLNKDDKKIFSRFIENNNKAHEILLLDNFLKGVDLGIKITTES